MARTGRVVAGAALALAGAVGATTSRSYPRDPQDASGEGVAPSLRLTLDTDAAR